VAAGLTGASFGITVAATAGAVLALMTVTFAVGRRLGRHSVIDTAWGIGLGLVAAVALISSLGHGQEPRRLLLTAASLIWGGRLAVYIGWRSRGQGEDPRYEDLLAKAGGHRDAYAFRAIYLTQAAVLWLATMPVQVGMFGPAPASAVTVIGAVVWLTGFLFETIGDHQLARFKADPANKGTIMNRGLWRYTRHPNYFGDACMWWGLFLIAFDGWISLATVVAPLLMTWLLVRGTGGRLTEQRMAQRPGYAEYMATTSSFIPLPPRPAAGAGRRGRRSARSARGRGSRPGRSC
jgi:steroid 5-alpha reductase family enzyme